MKRRSFMGEMGLADDAGATASNVVGSITQGAANVIAALNQGKIQQQMVRRPDYTPFIIGGIAILALGGILVMRRRGRK